MIKHFPNWINLLKSKLLLSKNITVTRKINYNMVLLVVQSKFTR